MSISVFVAGHAGLVGSALVRRLSTVPDVEVETVTRAELDLRDQHDVMAWMRATRPDQVYVAAGTVGGILANSTRQAEFLYDNLMIHANLIEASRQVGADKLLYLGSSCIYPRAAEQPIGEQSLLTGQLEPTNEGYALAKISGLRLCHYYRQQYGCDFISAMPTNLYGPGDNFDLETAHVLPALIRRFHDARFAGVDEVVVWGTGSPRREFLHVDDLADACVFLMDHFNGADHINVGSGQEVSIRDLAIMIRDVVHPDCRIEFDESKPDGMPRKLLDTTRLQQLGWSPSHALRAGIEATHAWFAANQHRYRGRPAG